MGHGLSLFSSLHSVMHNIANQKSQVTAPLSVYCLIPTEFFWAECSWGCLISPLPGTCMCKFIFTSTRPFIQAYLHE